MLKYADPWDHPAIHLNYLATKTDCKTIVTELEITHSIGWHNPIRTLITGEYEPGTEIADGDYNSLLSSAHTHATAIYHPVGTCKISDDKIAVIDKPKIIGR